MPLPQYSPYRPGVLVHRARNSGHSGRSDEGDFSADTSFDSTNVDSETSSEEAFVLIFAGMCITVGGVLLLKLKKKSKSSEHPRGYIDVAADDDLDDVPRSATLHRAATGASP